MDEAQALRAFAALSQDTRLRVVRMLVTAGPDGMAAGAIAAATGVSTSNLSFHLKDLEHARLVSSRRRSRSIIYSAAYPALSELIQFLMRDCCQGRPEVCAPALTALAACCTPDPAEVRMPERIYNVLFLCTHNSARSILAEALLNKLGAARFRAFSAGSRPGPAPNPLALKVLRDGDIATEGLRSKTWDEFAEPGAPAMDIVITVCDDAAGEPCPVWPGQPIAAHWGIEDPSRVGGAEIEREAAFVTAMRYLRNRISLLLALPSGSLDQMSGAGRLNEIGRMEGASSPSPDVA